MSNIINIGDHKKKKNDTKEDSEVINEIMDRIMDEQMSPDDQTEYTIYKDKAAKMLVDMLNQDVSTWVTNGKDRKVCYFDLKDIMIRAVKTIEEKELAEINEELSKKTPEELEEMYKNDLKELERYLIKGEDQDPEDEE